ncbi:hypothetical protein [Dinoroseobacter sp. S76]|uniref:hypothetical protein n=1 Tax=Dinoroseobacter sp. S76 TaxID=3415124 RepID=UPI003C7AE602
MQLIAKVLTEEDIVDASINAVNWEGGSSAVVMGYLNGKKGDGHDLMSIISFFITRPLRSYLPFSYASFTRLGIDPELLAVNPKSGLATMDAIPGAGGCPSSWFLEPMAA